MNALNDLSLKLHFHKSKSLLQSLEMVPTPNADYVLWKALPQALHLSFDFALWLLQSGDEALSVGNDL